MRKLTASFLLLALLLMWVLPVSAAHYTMTMITDRTQYNPGDIVTVSGQVQESGLPAPGRAVTISYNNPVGSIAGTFQYLTDGTGNYSGTFTLPAPGINVAGAWTVGGAAGDTSAQSTFYVGLDHIVVSPSAPQTVASGSTLTFTATGYDASNNPIPMPSVNWSTGGASGSVDASGLFTAVKTGTIQVRATSGSVYGDSGSITITPGPPASVTVTSANTVVSGSNLSLAAAASDANGNAVTGAAFTWIKTDGTGTATLSGSTLTGVKAGTVTVQSTTGSLSSTQTVTVTPGPVSQLVLTSPNIVASGSTLSVAADALDANSNPLSGTPVTFTVSNGSGTATLSGSTLTGVKAGTVVVTATLGTVTATQTVTVAPGPLAGITVTSAGSVAAGAALSLMAAAYDANGNAVSGAAFTWSETNGTGTATLSGSTLTGVYAGTVTVQATSNGVTGTQTVTVAAGAAATVTISSANTVVSGSTLALTANAYDANNNPVPNPSFVWSKADATGTATLSGSTLTGVKAGTVTVQATRDGVSGTQTVTVTPGAVAQLQFTAGNTVASGSNLTLTVTASDASGNTVANPNVTYTVTNGTGSAAVSGATLTGIGAGTVTVHATSGSASTAHTVTVTPGTLASITVTSAASAASGSNLTLLAAGYDSNGNSIPNPAFTWSETNGTGTAILSGSVLTGVLAGSVTVTATASGVTGSQSVTVTPGTVASLSITSASTVVSASPRALTVSAADAAGNPVLNPAVIFTVANGTGSATVSGSTLKGIKAGAVTLTARVGGVSATQTITVSPGWASQVMINSPASVASGSSITLTATTADAAGNPVAGGPPAFSAAAGTGTATLSGSMLTGVMAGTVTVQATDGTFSGSQTVTVTAGPVAQLTITHPTGSITAGTFVLPTAAANDAAGNPISKPTLQWSVANGTGTATISGAHLVGQTPGTVTLQASSNGVTATQTVTVVSPPLPPPPSPGVVTLKIVSSDSVVSGGAITLTAAAQDQNGQVRPDVKVTWSVSNGSGSATLSSNNLTGIRAGTVTVTATGGQVTATRTITVVPGAPAQVSISPASGQVTIGESMSLTAQARDLNGNALANPRVVWSVVSGLASLSGSGDTATAVLDGLFHSGLVVVKASVDNASATTTVTVLPITLSDGSTADRGSIQSTATGSTMELHRTDGSIEQLLIVDPAKVAAGTGGPKLILDAGQGAATAHTVVIPAAALHVLAQGQRSLVLQVGDLHISGLERVAAAADMSAADRLEIHVRTASPADSGSASAPVEVALRDLLGTDHLTPVAGGFLSITANLINGSNGQTVPLGQFASPVQVQMTFDRTGVDPELLVAYQLNSSAGRWEYVPSRVDLSGHQLTLTTGAPGHVFVAVSHMTFSDVPQHWARHEVEVLAAHKVVEGTSAVTFSPDAPVTRAEFAALMVRLLSLDAQDSSCSVFTDVGQHQWYCASIAAAARAGLIVGYQGEFRPDALISREAMAVIIARALVLAGTVVPDGTNVQGALERFQDRGSIAPWAQSSVAAAVKLSLITGRTGGIMDAQARTSRAEGAAILYRLLKVRGAIR